MVSVICFTTKAPLSPHVLHSYHIPDFFFIAAFLSPPPWLFAIHSSLFGVPLKRKLKSRTESLKKG